MKKIIILIIILFLITASIKIIKNRNNQEIEETVQIPKLSGDYEFTLEHNKLTRNYLVHVSQNYDGEKPTPLIIDLHGGGGSFESAIKGTQMNKKSDEEGFLVVYPNSANSKDGGKRWNSGTRIIETQKESTADDIGFLNAMLDDLELKYNIMS